MMDRSYSDRQLKSIIDGDYMPRERALAQQCLDVHAEAKAARRKALEEAATRIDVRAKRNADAADNATAEVFHYLAAARAEVCFGLAKEIRALPENAK